MVPTPGRYKLAAAKPGSHSSPSCAVTTTWEDFPPKPSSNARMNTRREKRRCHHAPAHRFQRRIMTVDQLRRGIEELGPGAYDELANISAMDRVHHQYPDRARRHFRRRTRPPHGRGRGPPRAAARAMTAHRPEHGCGAGGVSVGHIRTPYFLRGWEAVESAAGAFAIPRNRLWSRRSSQNAALSRPFRRLVARLRGRPADVLTADIFDHWLTRSRRTI